MSLSKKQIARFMVLPGIVPRLRELSLDLNWFASLMALIFVATRILPPRHPFAAPGAKEAFGIQDVLFEAGRHLKGGLRHADQYIVYGSFVLGLGLLVAQFAILLFMLAAHTAEAASFGVPSFKGMFVTRAPSDDIALMMLDKVFAIPHMFNSKFDAGTVGVSAFNSALHTLFAFYNEGMLFIAGLIFLYYIFAVVVETVQTGTPFGQRFQEVYVPIRIILALAFLVPLGYGFSAGQMLALKLAQWGSGFATNGWILFNQRAALNPLGADAKALSVMPKTEDVASLMRYYSLLQACRAIYSQEYGKKIEPLVVYKNGTQWVSTTATGLDYATALGYFENGPITVTFGQKDDSFTDFPGHVKPYCGTLNVPTENSAIAGAAQLHAVYWTFIQQLWTDSKLTAYGNRMATNFTHLADPSAAAASISSWPDAKSSPDAGFYADVRTDLQSIFESSMQAVRDQLRNSSDAKMQINADLLARGWGGAGIWFNKIAEYNGAIVTANYSIPAPSAYPSAMVALIGEKKEKQGGGDSALQFLASFKGGGNLRDAMSGKGLDDPAKDGQIAAFLGTVYKDMSSDDTYGDGSEIHDRNIVADTFNAIFGTEGLNDLRGNEQIHPLAKMSALGRSIINRAVTYIGGAMVMGGLSGLAGIFNASGSPGLQAVGQGFATAFSGIGDMFLSFAFIGIIVGIVLYYVIPFLPFLYFFFAVGRWVKTVFEAVVGIPLWALAHLKIDGEGISGESATQGYFLLLEILLRPILIVFGLMAAVSCFSALAIALDTVFDLVTTNVTGYNPVDASGAYSYRGIEFKRSSIDQFFYTIVYALLLYLMATSCFKLIDLIPQGVLRFIGTGVASFNDEMNLESNIVRYTALSAYSMGPQAGQAGKQFGNIAGQAVALPANMLGEVMGGIRGMTPETPAQTSAPPAAQPAPPSASAAAAPKPSAEAPASAEPASAPVAEAPVRPQSASPPPEAAPSARPVAPEGGAKPPASPTTPPKGPKQ